MGIHNLFQRPLHFEFYLGTVLLHGLFEHYLIVRQLRVVKRELRLARDPNRKGSAHESTDEIHKQAQQHVDAYLLSEDYHKTVEYARDKLVFQAVSSVIQTALSLLLLFTLFGPALWRYSGSLLKSPSETYQVPGAARPRNAYADADLLRDQARPRHGDGAALQPLRRLRHRGAARIQQEDLRALFQGPVFVAVSAGRHRGARARRDDIPGELGRGEVLPLCEFSESPVNVRSAGLRDGELKTGIENLAKSLKFPLREIKLMDGSKRSTHSNMYFYGLWWFKKIVVYDTLLKQPTPQIIGITAHELGHWKCNHTAKMLLLSYSHMFVVFYLFGRFKDDAAMFESFGYGDIRGFLVGITLFGCIYYPVGVLMHIIGNTITRRGEYEADNFAVKLGHGENLAKALVEIHHENKSMIHHDRLYSWCYEQGGPRTHRRRGAPTPAEVGRRGRSQRPFQPLQGPLSQLPPVLGPGVATRTAAAAAAGGCAVGAAILFEDILHGHGAGAALCGCGEATGKPVAVARGVRGATCAHPAAPRRRGFADGAGGEGRRGSRRFRRAGTSKLYCGVREGGSGGGRGGGFVSTALPPGVVPVQSASGGHASRGCSCGKAELRAPVADAADPGAGGGCGRGLPWRRQGQPCSGGEAGCVPERVSRAGNFVAEALVQRLEAAALQQPQRPDSPSVGEVEEVQVGSAHRHDVGHVELAVEQKVLQQKDRGDGLGRKVEEVEAVDDGPLIETTPVVEHVDVKVVGGAEQGGTAEEHELEELLGPRAVRDLDRRHVEGDRLGHEKMSEPKLPKVEERSHQTPELAALHALEVELESLEGVVVVERPREQRRGCGCGDVGASDGRNAAERLEIPGNPPVLAGIEQRAQAGGAVGLGGDGGVELGRGCALQRGDVGRYRGQVERGVASRALGARTARAQEKQSLPAGDHDLLVEPRNQLIAGLVLDANLDQVPYAGDGAARKHVPEADGLPVLAVGELGAEDVAGAEGVAEAAVDGADATLKVPHVEAEVHLSAMSDESVNMTYDSLAVGSARVGRSALDADVGELRLFVVLVGGAALVVHEGPLSVRPLQHLRVAGRVVAHNPGEVVVAGARGAADRDVDGDLVAVEDAELGGPAVEAVELRVLVEGVFVEVYGVRGFARAHPPVHSPWRQFGCSPVVVSRPSACSRRLTAVVDEVDGNGRNDGAGLLEVLGAVVDPDPKAEVGSADVALQTVVVGHDDLVGGPDAALLRAVDHDGAAQGVAAARVGENDVGVGLGGGEEAEPRLDGAGVLAVVGELDLKLHALVLVDLAGDPDLDVGDAPGVHEVGVAQVEHLELVRGASHVVGAVHDVVAHVVVLEGSAALQPPWVEHVVGEAGGKVLLGVLLVAVGVDELRLLVRGPAVGVVGVAEPAADLAPPGVEIGRDDVGVHEVGELVDHQAGDVGVVVEGRLHELNVGVVLGAARVGDGRGGGLLGVDHAVPAAEQVLEALDLLEAVGVLAPRGGDLDELFGVLEPRLVVGVGVLAELATAGRPVRGLVRLEELDVVHVEEELAHRLGVVDARGAQHGLVEAAGEVDALIAVLLDGAPVGEGESLPGERHHLGVLGVLHAGLVDVGAGGAVLVGLAVVHDRDVHGVERLVGEHPLLQLLAVELQLLVPLPLGDDAEQPAGVLASPGAVELDAVVQPELGRGVAVVERGVNARLAGVDDRCLIVIDQREALDAVLRRLLQLPLVLVDALVVAHGLDFEFVAGVAEGAGGLVFAWPPEGGHAGEAVARGFDFDVEAALGDLEPEGGLLLRHLGFEEDVEARAEHGAQDHRYGVLVHQADDFSDDVVRLDVFAHGDDVVGLVCRGGRSVEERDDRVSIFVRDHLGLEEHAHFREGRAAGGLGLGRDCFSSQLLDCVVWVLSMVTTYWCFWIGGFGTHWPRLRGRALRT
ncbi:CAAX metallo endopeptidase [Babesia caballi]|uniref:Ste24 endopeptidase n=1 Tax=Babesia caballi TaxID=5871 RepID=A0AAV4M1J8_BABCB|nr:CAAX metallo endopeptidase [Babesia caballi]